jgi:Uncharacterized protein conserved in archaea
VIHRIEAEITAPVHDTEVTDRVADAITDLFPAAEPEPRGGELTATVRDLAHLSELLHRQAILDTARGSFLSNQQDNAFSFQLKKQAAFEGIVNFVVEPGELGAIAVRVVVEEPDVESYVDHIAPPTRDGEPVDTSE